MTLIYCNVMVVEMNCRKQVTDVISFSTVKCFKSYYQSKKNFEIPYSLAFAGFVQRMADFLIKG